ncbi:MAG: hypothetical protein ABI890_06765 [Lapillicoccus sp.]
MTGPDDLTHPDDAAVIQLLRDAGRAAPDSLDVVALVTRSRRSARRHQLGAVAGSALLAAAVAVGAVTIAHHATPPALPAAPVVTLPTDPTTSSPSTASGSPGSEAAVAAALGPDIIASASSRGEATFGPRPGSATAASVPTGWALSGRVMMFKPGDIPLDELCAPVTEKGYTFQACTREVGPGGVRLLRRRQSGGGDGGTTSQVRFLHDLGGGHVRVIDFTLYNPAAVSAAELAQADAWVAAHEQAARRAAVLGPVP